MFETRDFQLLHQYKIRNDFDIKELPSRYFFCIDDKMLFIKKSRKVFVIVASCQCGFEAIYHESCLDVIYMNPDMMSCIDMFKGYCLRIIR